MRWGLNLLYGTDLPDQVHGAVLTAKLLPHLEEEKIAVYWYGTTPTTLALLREELARRHPGLVIAGMEPSRFGPATPAELDGIARADPGLWRADLLRRPRLSAPGDVRVGDARPSRHARAGGRRGVHVPARASSGSRRRSCARHGLEWLWRLVLEPRRLWRRYVLLNPAYLSLLAVQRLTGRTRQPGGPRAVPGRSRSRRSRVRLPRAFVRLTCRGLTPLRRLFGVRPPQLRRAEGARVARHDAVRAWFGHEARAARHAGADRSEPVSRR